MWEQLKRIWKLGDPKYLDFLDRQTRTVFKSTGKIHESEEKIYPGAVVKRPATIIQDDPLDIFPAEEENINDLTGKKDD